jgi:adenylate cyclase
MPIILITVKSDTKDVIVGLEAGAVEYLTKPIDQMAVVARVQSFYESRSFMIKCLRRQLSSPRGAARLSSGWRSSYPRSSALVA